MQANLPQLKQIYQDNNVVKSICDNMSRRTNNQKKTGTDRILKVLEEDGFDFRYKDRTDAFRLLEECECGRYVEGRHGWKSRFVWSVKSTLVAKAAQGQEIGGNLDDKDEPERESIEDELIEHIYVLRPELTISIELPVDFSEGEAQRLGQFINSLPFQE
jgi:SOS-response transcriptional repressor LexA